MDNGMVHSCGVYFDYYRDILPRTRLGMGLAMEGRAIL